MDNTDNVNHPNHYGGADNHFEPIKIIEHYNLGFCLGNAIKYILRAPYKGHHAEDLKKAVWYLNREIERLEQLNSNDSEGELASKIADMLMKKKRSKIREYEDTFFYIV